MRSLSLAYQSTHKYTQQASANQQHPLTSIWSSTAFVYIALFQFWKELFFRLRAFIQFLYLKLNY
jgi:uncharacterized membrane protein required for colicin V production